MTDDDGYQKLFAHLAGGKRGRAKEQPSGGSDHLLVRPSLADLTALEIRCSRAEGKSAIHAVESALKWMRDLLKAPTWTPALQAAWDMYRRGIDQALCGRPNASALPTEGADGG